MISFLLQLFAAISSVKALTEYAMQFAQGIMTWYINNQTNETLSQIADAAAMSARAQTDEERYKAAEAWQLALSRPRVTK